MNSLVSVIVSTYNSALFITETLDSIKRQTWSCLELIVTDDCSLDDTVSLCQTWLNENQSRFVQCRLILNDKNVGISANANRGLSLSNGEWIKFLGGDDTLKPRCIEDNMEWIAVNPRIDILFSDIEVYKDTFDVQNLIETIPKIPSNDNWILGKNKSAESQYKLLLTCDRIHFTPSVFMRRETIRKVGGYDERFKLLDDYPLWLKLTKTGYKLHYMPKITVNYRRHSKAVNYSFNKVVNPNYFKQEDFRREYIYPNLPIIIRLNAQFTWYVSQVFRFERLNRYNGFNKCLFELLIIYLNPFRYYIYLKRHIDKNIEANEYYQ